MIRIIAKVDGFRRGGMEHRSTPVEYAEGTFTPEELAVLRAEPMLLVDDVAVAPAAPATPGTGTLPPVSIADLDDLNPIELVDVAKAYGATLDPDADWDDLRADVEALMRAKADADSDRKV
jgi:hypothetical protein